MTAQAPPSLSVADTCAVEPGLEHREVVAVDEVEEGRASRSRSAEMVEDVEPVAEHRPLDPDEVLDVRARPRAVRPVVEQPQHRGDADAADRGRRGRGERPVADPAHQRGRTTGR